MAEVEPVAVKAMSPVVAIKKYFFEDGTPFVKAAAEIKALSDEDKRELAEGAARELGVSLTS